MKNNNEFMQGVIYACARINELHDQPTIADDVLISAGVNEDHFKAACEYDLEFLRSGDLNIPTGQEYFIKKEG